MGRKGQGSTEYIALVGIALIVLLVAVSFFVVEPQFAYSAKKQRSDDYWANARPFAIKNYAMSDGRAILELQNADPLSLSIKEIKLKNVSINFSTVSTQAQSATRMCSGGSCDLPMNPGQSNIVLTDDMAISAILQKLCFSGSTFQEGRYYEAELAITYQDSSGNGESETGSVPLVGQCTRIALNATACQVQSGNCSSSADCCSGNCQGGTCECMGHGGACASAAQCCSSLCSSGECTCSSDGVSCSSALQCCSGTCSEGACATLCQSNSVSCAVNSQCCSDYCSSGSCACKPSGTSCASDSQCCVDVPYCASGSCASCKPNGVSCSSDTQCCSGFTCNSGVCGTPGCKLNGNSCAADAECCGYCNRNTCASCK